MNEKEKKSGITTFDMVTVGMMAALVFIFTFIRIDFYTPLGKTMIHLGNVMCLLSALLFGKLRGGLAAGIGSMIFDMFDPVYISESWITFIMKFAMAYICGAVAHSGKDQKEWSLNRYISCAVAGVVICSLAYLLVPDSWLLYIIIFLAAYALSSVANHGKFIISLNTRYILGAVCGAVSYTVLYISKTIVIDYFVMGVEWETVLGVIITKGSISFANAIIAVIAALLLNSAIRPSLKKSRMLERFGVH